MFVVISLSTTSELLHQLCFLCWLFVWSLPCNRMVALLAAANCYILLAEMGCFCNVDELIF